MKPAKLPPLKTSKEAKPLQPLFQSRHKQAKENDSFDVSSSVSGVADSLESLPSLSDRKVKPVQKQEGTTTSKGSPSLSKQNHHQDVVFLPEKEVSSSTSNIDNFDDMVAIPPLTPPKFEKTGNDGEKVGLRRPQQSPNCFQKTKVVPRSGCRSAGEASSSKRCASREQRTSLSKPFILFTFKQFRIEVERFKKNKKINKLQEFYRVAFESFKSVNDAFKKPRATSSGTSTEKVTSNCSIPSFISNPNLQQKFVGFVYETLMEMPKEIQKMLLKGIINCLLSEWKGEKSESDLRAYFILLQNPMFHRIDTYVVFAHLLRQIATLNEHDQRIMVHWFRRLSTPRFRPLIARLHQFVTLRLFPGQSDELPPMSNCGWWIPSAVKVLSLLNKANNLIKPRLVSFREFYNHTLDHIDVMAEFRQWENPASHSGFTFCQFPFTLSLISKLRILRHDQERQMISSARDELVASIRRRPTRAPSVSQLFLNISVRRQHILQDSLEQIYGNRKQLKKKLRVEFIGEPGYDMGGLTKEWFLLLLRKVLSPDYNTFVYNERSRSYWFADNVSENSPDLFLVGVLMGLAVYNCITLDIRLPMICYRKLLSSVPRSPSTPNHPADSLPAPSACTPPTNGAGTTKKTTKPPSRAPTPPQPIGVVPVTLDDFRSIDPDMAHGLQELLDYQGDVEEDFGMTFQTSQDNFGTLRTIPLKAEGEKIAVTNQNRNEYVQALLNYKLNKSVYRQFHAFYRGFHTVCSSNALSFLCPEELETLVCGSCGFDLSDLKKYTTYQGYVSNDPTIIHLWDVLLSLSRDLQKRFLHFCTGSDRVPVGGMQEFNFKVIRTPTAQNMLPMAHTCFNQLLLPPYGSKLQLQSKLIIAISNAEGFGLE